MGRRLWLTFFTLQLCYPLVSIITSRGSHPNRRKRGDARNHRTQVQLQLHCESKFILARRGASHFEAIRDLPSNYMRVLRKTCATPIKLFLGSLKPLLQCSAVNQQRKTKISSTFAIILTTHWALTVFRGSWGLVSVLHYRYLLQSGGIFWAIPMIYTINFIRK